MSEVQSVFNKVIEAGIYQPLCESGFELMCFALKEALLKGVISKEEYVLTKAEIKEYLGPFGSLAGLLGYRDLSWDFESRLAIYKDWENRPKFKI